MLKLNEKNIKVIYESVLKYNRSIQIINDRWVLGAGGGFRKWILDDYGWWIPIDKDDGIFYEEVDVD